MTQQEARLLGRDKTTEVGRCTVPSFPDAPSLVRLPDGRTFAGGFLGYGVSYLTYNQQGSPYEITDFVASPLKEGE